MKKREIEKIGTKKQEIMKSKIWRNKKLKNRKIDKSKIGNYGNYKTEPFKNQTMEKIQKIKNRNKKL